MTNAALLAACAQKGFVPCELIHSTSNVNKADFMENLRTCSSLDLPPRATQYCTYFPAPHLCLYLVVFATPPTAF